MAVRSLLLRFLPPGFQRPFNNKKRARPQQPGPYPEQTSPAQKPTHSASVAAREDPKAHVISIIPAPALPKVSVTTVIETRPVEVVASDASDESHDEFRGDGACSDTVESPASSIVADSDIWAKLEAAGPRTVRLPDLFSSLMSVDCAICPHYETVREKSEHYIHTTWNFSEKAETKNHLIDFTYMAAAWAPLADEETLLTLADWMHWTFYFDDQFDEGHLSSDPIAAAEEIRRTLVLFEEDTPYLPVEEYPIGHVFQDVWGRIKKRAPRDLQRRFRKAITEYCGGVLDQVKVQAEGAMIGVDQYMAFRRASIGTYPSFALIEYCHGIDLPQKIIEHKSIAVCEVVASDITILHNDILSYKKDLAQHVQHNIIILLQGKGLGEQQAIDHVNDMLAECFQRWYAALVDLPVWGEKIDRDVRLYLDACRNVALGNLYWSFESGRYFGKDGALVRETRLIDLP